MIATAFRAVMAIAVPAAILAAGIVLAQRTGSLPASLAGLKVYGPWFILLAGAAISLAFNRGRPLFAIVALTAVHVAITFGWVGALKTFPERTVFAGMSILVPLYLGFLALARERGVFTSHGANRLVLLLALGGLVGWILFEKRSDITTLLYAPLSPLPQGFRTPIPQFGLVALAGGLVAGVAATAIHRTPIEPALALAIAAFAFACHRIGAPLESATYLATAGLLVTTAVLQDSYRMAFRDELTGLPSRRALNERLASLGSRYAVAMADVDHFKKCNDTYGHDVGDQVLRMVASRLARVGGGGRAYRYGGEEFAVVFPGASAADAMPYLEALRADIEAYQLALRGGDRPERAKKGEKRRGGKSAATSPSKERKISVTISIGVADPSDKAPLPDDVIRAADRALYRAKQKGRNRVVR